MAAILLVGGEGQDKLAVEGLVRLPDGDSRVEHGGDGALHVGGTAAVKLPVDDLTTEGVGFPNGPLVVPHGHYVGVAVVDELLAGAPALDGGDDAGPLGVRGDGHGIAEGIPVDDLPEGLGDLTFAAGGVLGGVAEKGLGEGYELVAVGVYGIEDAGLVHGDPSSEE